MAPLKSKTEIPNPRRILAVSLTNSAQHLSNVIKDITGTHPTPSTPSPDDDTNNTPSTTTTTTTPKDPPPPQPTLAGTTHTLPLTTPYYTASIPIWLDLIATPAEWSASFLSPEAREVLGVLGGVVVVFALPSSPSALTGLSAGRDTVGGEGGGGDDGDDGREAARELVRHVGKVVREGLGGWEWVGVGLVVGVGAIAGGGEAGEDGTGEELDEWEDLCAESGLEFVHLPKAGVASGKGKGAAEEEGKKRNEFGERVGVARVLEALEANDWAGGGMDEFKEGDEEGEEGKRELGDGEVEDDDEFDPEKLDFGFDRGDFAGLKKAIWSGGGDGEDDDEEEVGEKEVQKLEQMMMKLQAVRDASAGLPEDQRRRMAARAVGEVMKEL
ncbi:alpha and gamma adaptin binding protein p34-domain-containing protein [Dichotomopilus funicola]|uniref:Alpha and gamma adaptin binding protein p34-domain-containing protein n=1 Tax=Dichotomopilus funicola TaxID=1934379 RepID=A0AAN6V0X4_9PEZI|nr:alpha and gamma adaptin binding protein p34-domain-containing protein [Dichotomopilus funicola]